MQDYLIAIDVGTTSAKSFSISPTGDVLASHQEFYPTSFSKNGFAEQDPERIYNAVVGLIKKSHISSARCVGVSFSAAMHSLMAVDDEGKVILPLVIWSDTRSKFESRKIINAGLAQKFYEISGTPVHPMSPMCKLIWLKENQPDVFRRSYKFLSIKEYIFFKLTGKFVVDHSTASATGLFDLKTKKWSEEVLSYIGVDARKLSTPVKVDSKFFLQGPLASSLHLAPDPPLVVGASDGCLAQLGSRALGEEDVTLTLGTSGAVRVASHSQKNDPDGLVFNYLLNDQLFVCGGATNSGTVLLDWFKKSMDSNAPDDIDEFVKQACEAPPGCHGLLCIPFLLGERAPIYDPDASGIFWGVKIHHGKIYFQRALLEGICFELKWILETVEKNFGVRNNIILSGGITRSTAWVQLLCDILGRKIVTRQEVDASAMGAATLGFEALKIKFESTPANSIAYLPDHGSNQLHEKHFIIFKEIYRRLKDLKLEN
ncbi:MAG TPA: gluconokinase [Cyclobacteriaceae bacterium]|nr:gluconokinase [Cyclobacteriaceae bacterium]